MAHNQEMLEHNGSRWGDKVRIIGLSIDQTTEAVVKHVNAKGWGKVEHLHKAGSGSDDDYGVKGVPHIVLIGGDGKIAYAGHPASRKLEEDIETLLKGEKLKGVSDGDDEDEEDGSGFKDTDLAEVQKECLNFETQATDVLIKNSELKASASNLMRDFVVLVRETYFDLDTGKFFTKLENINVLVGPKTHVEAAKAQVESFLNNLKSHSFKSNWRVQAT